MSHLSKIEIVINDLRALITACQKMGLEFRENQARFKWYDGESQCTHAIRVPGARYEVGVIQNGSTFELAWDNWSSGGLVQKLGENAGLLKKQYSMERVRNEAREKRYKVREQSIQNGTRMVLTT